MRLPILTACLPLALVLTGLAACNDRDASGEPDAKSADSRSKAAAGGADSMAARDGAVAGDEIPDSEARPIMQAQVVLDRLGFSVGVVDGKQGRGLANAVRAFQQSRDLPETGELDEVTRRALAEWSQIPATRLVTIPEDWASLVFTPLPDDAAQQAKRDELGYESFAEKLAERFHTTPEVLAALNPGGRPAGAGGTTGAPAAAPSAGATGAPPAFRPGQQIRVPNIGADRIDPSRVDNTAWRDTLRALGVGSEQPQAARIVVEEAAGWLHVFDAEDRLVAAFTVTTGSRRDPLPIGDWTVKGVARNPTFVYNPELFWDVDDSEDKQHLPPGPNSPVGVVWIDLSKEHYGIHGTPEPQLIGLTQSHGCVRLTNWDAARLAQMVRPGVKVEFRK